MNDIDTSEDTRALAYLYSLRKGKKTHDEFAIHFKTKYKIGGKLQDEWRAHFKVDFPPDMNTQICFVKASELATLHQEASNNKSEAEGRMTALKNANDIKYGEKYTSLVAEYNSSGKKLPSKDTLATLVETELSDIKSAISHAEIELSFWKDILNNLAYMRRILETVTIDLGIEAKTLQQEKYIDRLNSNHNHNDNY